MKKAIDPPVAMEKAKIDAEEKEHVDAANFSTAEVARRTACRFNAGWVAR